MRTGVEYVNEIWIFGSDYTAGKCNKDNYVQSKYPLQLYENLKTEYKIFDISNVGLNNIEFFMLIHELSLFLHTRKKYPKYIFFEAKLPDSQIFDYNIEQLPLFVNNPYRNIFNHISKDYIWDITDDKYFTINENFISKLLLSNDTKLSKDQVYLNIVPKNISNSYSFNDNMYDYLETFNENIKYKINDYLKFDNYFKYFTDKGRYDSYSLLNSIITLLENNSKYPLIYFMGEHKIQQYCSENKIIDYILQRVNNILLKDYHQNIGCSCEYYNQEYHNNFSELLLNFIHEGK